MPCVQLMAAELRHLAWVVGRTPMICRVSKIYHCCEQPVTPKTWSKLWAVEFQVQSLIRPYGMLTYKTVEKNLCWQPNISPFSSLQTTEYTPEMKLPPRLCSVLHYSIAVPNDEHMSLFACSDPRGRFCMDIIP